MLANLPYALASGNSIATVSRFHCLSSTPESSPTPADTMIISIACSSSSNPSVPCTVMVSGESYGGIYRDPRFVASPHARVWHAASDLSINSIVVP